MSSFDLMQQNYDLIKGKIAHFSKDSPRSPSEIELLAVSKTQSTDKIRALYAMGQRRFGENYAQDLFQKAGELKDLSISWLYIGRLQSNKLKRLVEVTDEILSLASIRHAHQIERHAIFLNKTPFPVYLAVNAAAEATKNGCSMTETSELYQKISLECPHLLVKGLFALPPSSYTDANHPGEIPKLYHQLYELSHAIGGGNLSLGMSDDLGIAIRAGSTMVRIGSAIFGQRS